MFDKEPILKLIKSEVQSIVPDASVLLFGSRAYGIPTVESDWDILILTKNKYPRATKGLIRDKLFPLSVEQAAFINLVLAQQQEWETSPNFYALRMDIGNKWIMA